MARPESWLKGVHINLLLPGPFGAIRQSSSQQPFPTSPPQKGWLETGQKLSASLESSDALFQKGQITTSFKKMHPFLSWAPFKGGNLVQCFISFADFKVPHISSLVFVLCGLWECLGTTFGCHSLVTYDLVSTLLIYFVFVLHKIFFYSQDFESLCSIILHWAFPS